jgi:hypothetical protein
VGNLYISLAKLNAACCVQVLQSVFLKCETVVLGGTILDAISTIYHGDNANYFLLQVINQVWCCGFGSGIRCLFDPGIRMGKNPDPG